MGEECGQILSTAPPVKNREQTPKIAARGFHIRSFYTARGSDVDVGSHDNGAFIWQAEELRLARGVVS